jgi:hypothetical protein
MNIFNLLRLASKLDAQGKFKASATNAPGAIPAVATPMIASIFLKLFCTKFANSILIKFLTSMCESEIRLSQ